MSKQKEWRSDPGTVKDIISGNTSQGPVIFDLKLDQHRSLLAELKKAGKIWQEHDTFRQQLAELIRVKDPLTFFRSRPDDNLLDAYEGVLPHEQKGNWVFYPWSGQLVHILSEADFILLRTNRNRDKILPEEAAALATKMVGVVGMSVGQTLALTLAMERSCGKLILADFDELELSNLNRLRGGVHQLGVSKCQVAARAISELDPYFPVEIWEEGITPENLDVFVKEVDLIADECDGLDIKLALRYAAQKTGKPVVMETSDRGLLDVERFDLEPSRPLFHGSISRLEPVAMPVTDPSLRQALLFSILDVHSVSQRLRASYEKVGRELLTWPQLASAVSLGGGVAADTIRRIFLGHFCDSGRYYVDLESLVKGPTALLSNNDSH